MALEEDRDAEPRAGQHHIDAANAGTASGMRSPAKTMPACSTSPARTKNESTACLALYFASRLVGSHSACLVVLPSE